MILRLRPWKCCIIQRGGDVKQERDLSPEQDIPINILTMSCAIPIGPVKRTTAELLAAILKRAITLTLGVDSKEIEVVNASTKPMGNGKVVEQSSIPTSSIEYLHFVDRNAPNGIAELVFCNIHRVLRQAWECLTRCTCEGRGCYLCCGPDIEILKKYHMSSHHVIASRIISELLTKLLDEGYTEVREEAHAAT